MAEKEVKKAAVKAVETEKAYETEYTISELVEASSRFGVKPVIAKTALLSAGKESFTISEAQKIINTFKNKEVRV